MKITLSIAILFASVFFWQQNGFAQKQDSVSIEMERVDVSNNLKQLRDSISNTLQAFGSYDSINPAPKERKLGAVRKELLEHHARVILDLEEVNTTAQNGWNDDAQTRIQLNLEATRKEYNRIRATLGNSSKKGG